MNEPVPFLLAPGNAAYVEGKVARPVPNDEASTFTFLGRLVLFFVILLTGLTVFLLGKRALLLRDGETAVATVVAQQQNQQTRRPRHFLVLDFNPDAQGGAPQKVRVSASAAEFETHPVGSKMVVRYLPAHPDEAIAEDAFHGKWVHFVPLATTGLLLGLSCWALFWGERQRRLDQRLSLGCQILPGQVVRCWGESTGSGYWFNVQYRFLTPDQRTLTGKARLIRPDLARKGAVVPGPGDPVAIAYRDPKTHRLL